MSQFRLKWTPDHDAELRRLFEAGMVYSEIGKKLGVSKNAAIGRSRRLNLAYRLDPKPSPAPRADKFPGHGKCVYPHGHPEQPNFHFCGQRALPEKPYCDAHIAVCYVKGTALALPGVPAWMKL